MENWEKITIMIAFLLLIGMVVTVINVSIDKYHNSIELDEYCKDIGYKGYFSMEDKCYIIVPHESGIGYKYEYSGKLQRPK